MKKSTVHTSKAPPAIGPYSQGIQVGDLIFASMQLGIDPASKKLVEGGIRAQTSQALVNLKEILIRAGVTLNEVVRITLYLKDMGHFGTVNEIYSQHFEVPYPARSVISVTGLPLSAEVGIDAIAYSGKEKGNHADGNALR